MAKFVKLVDSNGEDIIINVDHVLWFSPADAKTTIVYFAAMNKDYPVSVVVKGAFEDIEKNIK